MKLLQFIFFLFDGKEILISFFLPLQFSRKKEINFFCGVNFCCCVVRIFFWNRKLVGDPENLLRFFFFVLIFCKFYFVLCNNVYFVWKCLFCNFVFFFRYTLCRDWKKKRRHIDVCFYLFIYFIFSCKEWMNHSMGIKFFFWLLYTVIAVWSFGFQ